MAQSWTAKKKSALLKRLRGWLFVTSEEREPLACIELHHENETGDISGSPIVRWFRESFSDADTLGSSIMETATEDVSNIGGTQRYRLVAKFGAGAVTEHLRFSLYGAREEDDPDLTGGAPSEAPNGRGLVAQLMRHMESRDRTFTSAVGSVLDKLASENMSLRQAMEASENRRIKMAELQEQLLNREAERRQAALDAEAKRAMMMEAVKTAKMLAPVMGNYFAGEKIFPEADMTQEMLAQFFDTLPPENWRAMVAAAPPQHQMALNMLLKQHLDKKEKAQGTYQGDRPLDAAPASPQLGTGSNGKPS